MEQDFLRYNERNLSDLLIEAISDEEDEYIEAMFDWKLNHPGKSINNQPDWL